MSVALANQEQEARIALRLDHHVFPASGQRGMQKPRVKHRPIIVDPPIFLLNHDHRPNG
jgi:hypothetical protein